MAEISIDAPLLNQTQSEAEFIRLLRNRASLKALKVGEIKALSSRYLRDQIILSGATEGLVRQKVSYYSKAVFCL